MKLLKFNMNSSSFYKIINILSLIFVIISLIIAYMLYGKREELFKNNEKMASAVTRIAIALDKGSGTSVGRISNLNGIKDPNQVSMILGKVEKQAKEIIKQRNNMGKALEEVTANLQLPVKLTADQFRALKTYQQSSDEVVKMCGQVNDRNELLVDCLVGIAEEIRQPVENEEAFKNANKNLQGFSDTLDGLLGDVKAMNTELSETKKVVTDSENKIAKLEKELSTAAARFSSNKEMETLVEEYERQLEDLQNENATLVDTIGKQQVLQGDDSGIDEKAIAERLEYEKKLKEIKSKLYLRLTGEVLKYNEKWGFAIINLGKFNRIDFNIDGKDEMATVALPLNSEMFVSRDGKFIAKVKVVKVIDNYAVVNLSSPSDGLVQKGDMVSFPVESS